MAQSNTAASLALALGSALTIAARPVLAAENVAGVEKCFGIALKGKNDCNAGAGNYLSWNVENRLSGQLVEDDAHKHLR
jgi:uncharacterized membrane protein